jgi:hypothetical protein
VVAHLEWPLIGVLPLLLLSKFAKRVYVEVRQELSGCSPRGRSPN